jgi:signal transduction histidine kinase
MHDGVGGQLVTVLNLLQEQSGEIFRRSAERVSRSLIDLHFVIDSLDPEQYELPTLLGTMRMRLADQIEAAGIQLEWAVTDLPEVSGMTPTRCLHIMRIVQEAITNAIKHSGSESLRVETGANEAEVFIDVIDRGQGIGDVEEAGHGLKNMRYRASQLDARLDVESSEKGTRVRLLIPL